MEVEFKRLDWDSAFFRLEVGSIQIDYFDIKFIPEIEKIKKDNGFDLIYLFIRNINTYQKGVLETAGAKLVDEKVTFKKEISGPAKSLFGFESYTGEVSPRLLELALASGHKSRFYNDPRTKHLFPALYRTWIENSVNRSIADEVLISKHEGEISGFVTLKKKDATGSIGLIAVHESMRGMGIGKELMNAANNWYAANGCLEAIVVTQKDNEQACILYEKTGYIAENSQFIFHL
jgi:dTDP-4-amino-4,6-dideoxy-D-galactose acyltransferase